VNWPDAVQLIIAEHKHIERKFDRVSCAEWTDLPDTKFRVLAEEVGEIAHALNEHDDENLMEEIVQVAAVALAWLLSDFEYREIEYRYD